MYICMYISTYCTQHIPSSMPKTYVLQGVVIHWVLCPSSGVKVGKCCTGCPHFFLVFFPIWLYSGLPMDGLPCYVEHMVIWELDGFVFNCKGTYFCSGYLWYFRLRAHTNSETHCIDVKWLFHQLSTACLHATSMLFGQMREDIAALYLWPLGANLSLMMSNHISAWKVPPVCQASLLDRHFASLRASCHSLRFQRAMDGPFFFQFQ